MNRLFVFLIVLVICVVGIGFYQSWFTVSSRNFDSESHKVNVNVTMDPDKVKADAEIVKEKALELTGQATEEAHDVVDQPSDSK